MQRTAAVVLSFPICGALASPSVAQQELFKLTESDGAAGNEFGRSVSISGGLAVVGAPNWVDATEPGYADVFDVTTGQELFKLIASDGSRGDGFGFSVAIGGSLAVIGAPWVWSAYVFDVTTGQELFELAPSTSGGGYGRYFGEAVSINGDRSIIGDSLDSDAGTGAGAAYVFDVSTGQQLFKLTASDASTWDFFGHAVSISGDRAVVGSASGSAYVFDVRTGRELFKLTASDPADALCFGCGVAVSGEHAVVHGWASAYVFDVTNGQELFRLAAPDGDVLTGGVAISGNRAFLGAQDENGTEPGSAYVFDVTTGQELFELTASDGAGVGGFGQVISISGDRAVVGAWDHSGMEPDSAYVFSIPGHQQGAFCFGDGSGAPCPCANTGGPGEGCSNSGGAGGLLSGGGSVSASADDLVFTASNLLPSQPVLLFVGLDAISGGNGTPFGDGLRCAGGSVVRLGVEVPSANGDAIWGPRLRAQGGWSSGDTRRFQGWYRDPGGPCSSGFNLTNGIEVTFTP